MCTYGTAYIAGTSYPAGSTTRDLKHMWRIPFSSCIANISIRLKTAQKVHRSQPQPPIYACDQRRQKTVGEENKDDAKKMLLRQAERDTVYEGVFTMTGV